MSESPDARLGQTHGVPKRKRRVCQACEPCRIRKAKCDRGSDDDPQPPPCARCRRESIQSQCILGSKRHRRTTEPLGSHEQNEATSRAALSSDLQTSWMNTPAAQNHGTTAPHLQYPHDHDASNGNGEIHSPNSPHLDQRRRTSNAQLNLTDNVMHTLVSKPNDALSLLFEAASRQDASAQNSRPISPDIIGGSHISPGHQSHHSIHGGSGADDRRSVNLHLPHSSHTSPAATLPKPSSEVLELWSRYRFVRRGWITATEAVQYVDLFFRNLSPLSPVLLDYYADHSNHSSLISDEPMLCTTIFVISTRYHVLPDNGGILRSDDLHRKFWAYWKTLFMRVVYSQDTGPNPKTRGVGTIESFLLMTEWHARALHFPGDVDGCDYNLADSDDEDENRTNNLGRGQHRSTEEIEGAARRSDRMSWMLLGCALTLAHELGISDQNLQNRELRSEAYSDESERLQAEFIELRRSRPKRLLYVYINQLASRLGWTSMLPRIISESAEQPFGSEAEKQWHNVMSRWIGLTRLMKTASDMLFSSTATKELLRTGKYVTSLEHFGQLLEDWHTDYLKLNANKKFLDILFIEFQFARAYINSLSVQAIVGRAFKIAQPASGPTEFLMTFVFESHSVDHAFVKEVVEGSREILKKVLEFNEEGVLRFYPVRIFSRLISASILLLKATGLGARTEEAQISLELIDNLIGALRFDPVDELHLANRYASLLETYVKAFSKRFLRVSRSRDNPRHRQLVDGNYVAFSSDERQQQQQQRQGGTELPTPNTSAGMNFNDMMAVDGGDNLEGNDISLWAEQNGISVDILSDDWMCLPLDALDPGIMEFNNGLGARGLEFFTMV